MSQGLLLHRIGIVCLTPVVWVMATIAYIICAPISAAEAVWSAGLFKHWNDQ